MRLQQGMAGESWSWGNRSIGHSGGSWFVEGVPQRHKNVGPESSYDTQKMEWGWEERHFQGRELGISLRMPWLY